MNRTYPDKEGIHLYRQRVKNLLDAVSFKEPDKVPVGFDYISWPYGYAGVTLEEVIEDPAANARAYTRFMNDIEFDLTFNPGMYMPYTAYQALGSEVFFLCDDKCTVQHNQALHNFISDDDFDVLIDHFSYFINAYYPKKYLKAFQGTKKNAYRALKTAAQEIVKLNEFTNLVAKTALFEYQILLVGTSVDPKIDESYNLRDTMPMYFSTLDDLFDKYRGMENVFYDLVDNPEKIDRAIAAIEAYKPEMKWPDRDYSEYPLPFALAGYHVAPFLNTEQYEKYWFQGFKNRMLPFAEQGLKIFLKGEGSFLHTIERFKDFPPGSILIQLDSDDPIEAKRKLGGTQSLAAGIKTSMLSPIVYDKKRCFDHLKRMFDELAPGGGFVFYQDMPLLSPSDADPYTIQEVWDFVNNLAKGKA
ncbi:MAG: hypothetical protein IJ106_11395 [Parasporobacterium sp.]|nr:hypothetical protein [Parasporobacterium sp.]